MVLFELFIAFLRIGLFSFGGGAAFLPLIEREVVENYHWLDKAEFLEVLGLIRVIPGAISVQFATYTGYKVAGIPGVLVANIANLFPPVLFIIIALLVYSKYKDVAFVKAGLAGLPGNRHRGCIGSRFCSYLKSADENRHRFLADLLLCECFFEFDI